MTPKINALFLTKYTQRGASSRYRAYMYQSLLEQSGVRCTIAPLLSDTYLVQRYARQRGEQHWLRVFLTVLLSITKRLKTIYRELQQYDVVYLQYEALPYLPFILEKKLFTVRTPVVVDYDDATHVIYEQHANPFIRRVLGNKIRDVVRHSRYVITGNHYLADWAKPLNSNVTVIPTSVDLNKYQPKPQDSLPIHKPVVGWIGTPVTAKYLYLIAEPLRRLRQEHDFVLRVIGAPDFRLEGITVDGRMWKESTEVADLQSCDIGIMPLPNEAWERGKSALKLIQYLAAGVAGVASPVGANCDVVQEGVNGLLAATHDEWFHKLRFLIQHPSERDKLAQVGRQSVEQHFSIQANAPLLEQILRQAFATRPF